MGFCSEERKLDGIIPDMSVADNLTLALAPALSRSCILDEKKQREIVLRYIKDIGIKCAGPGQKIKELSGGNQQKVLLAVGGNEAAARLSGVPTARVKYLVYGFCGLVNGLAGLIVIAVWLQRQEQA